jgi:hypothetical protein
VPQPSSLSFLGVAKESVKGAFIAATDYIPLTGFEPADSIVALEDNALRGSMVDLYGLVQGPKFVTYKASGPAFNDSLGYWLGTFFGDCTTTGAGAPFTHAFAVKNSGDAQPLAYSLTDFYVAATRAFVGMQCHDLSFKFSGDGFLTYEAMLTGLSEALQTKPTATFGARPLVPVWQAVTTIGGVVAATLIDGEFNLSRSVQVIHTADGSQQPYAIFMGSVSLTGKANVVMEDDTRLLELLNNTQPSVDFLFAQDGNNSIKLHATKAAYTGAPITRDGIFVRLPIEFSGVANATDAGASGGLSPAKVTLLNAKPAATFV